MVTDRRSGSLRTVLLFASTYAFPAIGFPLVTYAWWRSSGSWPFVVVVMGVPVVFGYLMPWIATSVVKRWRFTGARLRQGSGEVTPKRMHTLYGHHGFIYGAKLAFALLLVIRSLDSVGTPFEVVSVMLVAGAATAFGGWFHDTHAVRAGQIEIAGGIDALATFAPPSYFTMGATYAGVTLAARRVLLVDPESVAWVFVVALVVLLLRPDALAVTKRKRRTSSRN
jgi:hypothetical protein